MRRVAHWRWPVGQLEQAPSGARHRTRLLRGDRERPDRLERREREQGEHPQPDAADRAGSDRGRGDREHGDERETGSEDNQRLAQPGDAPVPAPDPAQLSIHRIDTLELPIDPSEGDELRRSHERLDGLARQLGPGGRLVPSALARRLARHRGGDKSTGGETGKQHDRGYRQHNRRRQYRACADDERHQRRPHGAQEQELHRLDIGDETAEQIAASRRAETSGNERLQALVKRDAQGAQEAEGRVVRNETLGVAKGGARDAEELHQPDRHAERENRRLQRRLRNQVARGRHQTDPGSNRAGAE